MKLNFAYCVNLQPLRMVLKSLHSIPFSCRTYLALAVSASRWWVDAVINQRDVVYHAKESREGGGAAQESLTDCFLPISRIAIVSWLLPPHHHSVASGYLELHALIDVAFISWTLGGPKYGKFEHMCRWFGLRKVAIPAAIVSHTTKYVE